MVAQNNLIYEDWHKKALTEEEWTRAEVRAILEELYLQRLRVLELEEKMKELEEDAWKYRTLRDT